MEYGGFVDVDGSMTLHGAGMEALIRHIKKAREEALKAGIEANMVAIDREFARVKGFPMQDFEGMLQVPDMICGLKVIFDDLPMEDHAFWVFRSEKVPENRLRQLEEENAELKEKLRQVKEVIERYDMQMR